MADSGPCDVTCSACGRTWVVEVPDPVPPHRYLYSLCPDCGTGCRLHFAEAGRVRAELVSMFPNESCEWGDDE